MAPTLSGSQRSIQHPESLYFAPGARVIVIVIFADDDSGDRVDQEQLKRFDSDAIAFAR